jgi:hypothetical protein
MHPISDPTQFGVTAACIVVDANFVTLLQRSPALAHDAHIEGEPLEVTKAHEFFMVGATGFEPATPASRTQYSTRLSYAPIRVTEKDANSNKDCLYADGGKGSIAIAAASASRCAAARA